MKKIFLNGLFAIGILSSYSLVQAQTFVNFTIVQDPVLSLSAGAGSTICSGQMANLQGAAVGGNGAYTYQWSPSISVTNPSSNNTTANPTSTTSFILEVTDGNNCNAFDTVIVTLPFQPLTVDAGTGSTICPGSTASLSGTSNGGYGSNVYLWSPSTGLTSTTTLNTTSNATTTTTYYLTVTDSNLCSSMDSVVVNVLDCSGVNEESQVELLVYPNPSTGIFTISTNYAQQAEIQVTSVTGTIVYVKPFSYLTVHSIDLSDVAKGIYIVTLEVAGNKISKTISIQ